MAGAVFRYPDQSIGDSSNGRTADSDSVCGGSNPPSPANMEKPTSVGFSFFGEKLQMEDENLHQVRRAERERSRTVERSDAGPEGVRPQAE
jgi:hypothetical protein